ncbi:MAG: flagellar motor stator protein MotA [Rhodospirillales bacterium]|nr:flagellar motor stator protein MotA [Alphaproteobacteria bacterium]MCB9986097.1 flagellar motor stator protein MotA [Rhodospirillales bacterium]USO07341.1 MAG: flagellar motor stator protein MotA [Rhodospirillales bacterium]
MLKIIGLVAVIVCTFGGFLIAGGKVEIITHVILHALPGEGLTIMGCAVSAFIIANSPHVIKETLHYLKLITKPEAHSKEDYLELLGMLYLIFRTSKQKGWLALEAHIENPDESEIFKQFPKFNENHHARTFLCDYLRIISLGNDNPLTLEALMDQELETLATERRHPGHAVQTMADGIPALGIVAAVLGVIKTMGSITEPPEILGEMIGGALVGTFLGVWMSYGYIAPLAGAINSRVETEIKYYVCIKVAILALLQGCAPQVAVEFARKTLHHDAQPTFLEVEEATNKATSGGSAAAA